MNRVLVLMIAATLAWGVYSAQAATVKPTALEKKIAQLEKRIAKLEADRSMPAPMWAKDIAQEAYDRHYIEKVDGHSYDFYRVLNMMYQAGAL